MTTEQFIEKFCPDYKDRFNSIREEYRNADDEIISALVGLQDKAFEEALQNFTNKICEKQRMECAESASIVWIDVFNFSAGYRIDVNSILNAEQPKIEDL